MGYYYDYWGYLGIKGFKGTYCNYDLFRVAFTFTVKIGLRNHGHSLSVYQDYRGYYGYSDCNGY